MAEMAIGVEICAIVGAFIGTMIGTLGPFYKKKKELGMDDVTIFFDKKFLKASIVSAILSAVAVGGAFPVILENVNPNWSYISTIIFSAVLAITLNLGGNVLLGPSEITMKAEKKMILNKTNDAISRQIDDTINKLNFEKEDIEKAKSALYSGHDSLVNDCHCKKCSGEEGINSTP